MFLKALTMHGFKSFPDKTVISFDRGITAIVGPNGSGKSNISDAVRWVLGEMSPKSLRGSKMEDVIFNGTTKRKPASYAEVVMTLDNTDRRSTYDSDEINVCRRLYRSGESEYYINQKQVRLKDIVDIFLNTGIGKEGYSVIGQGKIADVISTKSDERRGIFEEAAGISRLRYQKKDAENKLVRVSDNLLRISDILTEVEGRLPTLERQSEKAGRYLVLKTERTELEVSSFAERIALIDKEKAEVDKTVEKESERLRAIGERQEALDAEVDRNYIGVQSEKLRESHLRQEKDDIVSSLTSTVSKLSIYENDISHFEQSVAEIENEEKEAKARLTALAERREELLLEIEKGEKSLSDCDALVKDKHAEATLKRQELDEAEAEVERKRLDVDAVQSEKNENDLMQKEGESYNLIRRERLDNIGAQKDAAAKAKADAEKEKRELNSALDDITEEIAKKEIALSREKERLLAFDSEIDGLEEMKQKARLRLLEINQRRETLSRMDRLLDGFSGSVKAIMGAQESGTLTGIHGPVSKLILTDNEYITAIETCLGAAMQNIVVDDEAAAKNAIGYLKRTNQGRATFLPLTTVSGVEADVSAVCKMQGFVSVASKLIKCDEKYNNIVKSLLGRTVVATDIDSAGEIARRMNYKIRLITLDGQLINQGGSFTGGQSLKNSAILSRRADIEKLEGEATSIEKTIKTYNQKISGADGEREKINGAFLEIERELELLKSSEDEKERALDIIEERLLTLSSRLDEIQKEYDGVLKTSEVTRDNLASITEKGRELEAKLLEAKARLDGASGRVEKLKAEIFTLMEDATKVSEEKGAVEVSLAAAKEKLNSLAATRTEIEGSINDGRGKIKEQTERRECALENIATTKLEKIDLEKAIVAKEAEIKAAEEAISKLESVSMSLRAEQKQLEGEKEEALRLHARFSSRQGELEKEKTNILERLAEDYEMDFDTAVIYAASAKSNHTLTGKEREDRLTYLRAEMKKLGSVNLESIEEYKETKERYDFLKEQFDDTDKAKRSLEKLLLGIENTMRETFSEALKKIQKAFKETFVELFGGGNAEIVVSGEDVLECTIDINVQPPGKIIKNLSLLSGGEQSIVAIALYLAILKVSPSPFCIFDEIEAALDEANVNRFGEYLKKYSISTQFIVITHRRGTMEAADMLYGITMQEKGVSDYIRVSLDEYQGEIS